MSFFPFSWECNKESHLARKHKQRAKCFLFRRPIETLGIDFLNHARMFYWHEQWKNNDAKNDCNTWPTDLWLHTVSPFCGLQTAAFVLEGETLNWTLDILLESPLWFVLMLLLAHFQNCLTLLDWQNHCVLTIISLGVWWFSDCTKIETLCFS